MLKKRRSLQVAFWAWVAAAFLFVLVVPVSVKMSFCEPSGQHQGTVKGDEPAAQKKPDDEKGATKTGYREYLGRSGFCDEAKITDMALVFFTCCLVIVGWFTIRSGERNMRDLERADMAGTPGIHPQLSTPQRHIVILKMRNYGRTHGNITRINLDSRVGEPTERLPTYQDQRTRPLIATLEPTITQPVTAPIQLETPPDHNVIFGFVEYNDVFGELHTSRFCNQIFGDDGGVRVVGPPAWNDWN